MTKIPQPPAGPVRTRPPSAREHFALVQQIRSSIAQSAEQPPHGVPLQLVSSRRELLEGVLRDLERQGHADNTRRHSLAAARREAADALEERRVASAVEESGVKHATHFITNLLQKKDVSEARQEKIQQHHQKVNDCRAFYESTMASRIHTLEKRDKDRQSRLESLGKTREESVRRIREARMVAASAAEAKRQAALDHEERTYSSRLESAEQNRRYREQRALSARTLRDEQLARKREIQLERKFHGPGRKTSVFFGGGKTPTLCTVYNDHADRMRLLAESEARSRDNYALDVELRDAMRVALEMRTNRRRERASDNYDKILDSKLQRFDELKRADIRKRDHVEALRKSGEVAARAVGRQKAIAIASHQVAAEALEADRVDRSRHNNAARWNRRADAAVDSILEKYAIIKSPQSPRNDFVTSDGSAVVGGN